jgi:hypothetical protein
MEIKCPLPSLQETDPYSKSNETNKLLNLYILSILIVFSNTRLGLPGSGLYVLQIRILCLPYNYYISRHAHSSLCDHPNNT